MINKELVEQSFKKNLKTYDDNAFVQKEMAKNLLEFVPKDDYTKVFEIGSGTGFFTKLLVEKVDFEELYANDIVPECKIYLSKNMNFLKGDIEEIELPKSFDLVVSNAVLQWVNDYGKVFSKISSSLKDDGLFVFSTFGENNFYEFKHISGIGLSYLSLDKLKELLLRDFEIIDVVENTRVVHFATFRELLMHIKLTGVNGVSGENISISKLKKIEKDYASKCLDQNGFSLTYNPIYVRVKKKFRQNV